MAIKLDCLNWCRWTSSSQIKPSPPPRHWNWSKKYRDTKQSNKRKNQNSKYEI